MRMSLLKAFVISIIIVVLLLSLLIAGVWRYTSGILDREHMLASSVLPNLEVAHQLTAATAGLQAQEFMLQNAESMESLRLRARRIDHTTADMQATIHKGFYSSSERKSSLSNVLRNIQGVVTRLVGIKAQHMGADARISDEQRYLFDELASLRATIQDYMATLTGLVSPAQNGAASALADFGVGQGEQLSVGLSQLDLSSGLLYEALQLDLELVELRALLDKVAFLPTPEQVELNRERSDSLIQSMMSRVVELEQMAADALLLSPLAQLSERLTRPDNIFDARLTILDLDRRQSGLSNLLAEQTRVIVATTDRIRLEAEATVVSTSEKTLDQLTKYRWLLGSVMGLAIVVLGSIVYGLFYRRTIVPLGVLTSQLDVVGSDQFKGSDTRYFFREMDALSVAVNDLDAVQRAMKDKDQELKQRNSELARANEDLEQFAHIASHDLQEPLRKLQQFSGLLDEEYSQELGEDGQFYLSAITQSSRRMSLMISDTLEYARSSSSSQSMEMVDLRELVTSLSVDLDVLIKESGTQIHMGELPVVNANLTGMSQLFRNLLVNSMKYRREEVPCTIRIDTLFSADGQEFIIEFEDNGIGIKEEHKHRVFAPFERLKTSQVTGTGLGLAICQKVCDAHDWIIDLRSEEGKGTCFIITGPVSHLCATPSSKAA